MKAILINSVEKTVSFVEIDRDNFLDSCYKAIGCQLIEVAVELTGNTIYVDEEGLCKQVKSMFEIIGYHPFVGNGLVVGYDKDKDEHHDTDLSIQDIHDMMNFLSDEEVAETMEGMTLC